ncbi:MAG TPA: hypothetical protein VI384_03525 [Candidatus Dormibacteraeota bacterium]
MTSLYAWLLFVHLSAVALFLMAHGVSAAAAFVIRGQGGATTRPVLKLSQQSVVIAYPALLVVVITGVWMGFIGSWWRQGWIWASIVVFVATMGAMSALARPYYKAREAGDAEMETYVAQTRPITLLWIGIAGLLLLIALMTLKPF